MKGLCHKVQPFFYKDSAVLWSESLRSGFKKSEREQEGEVREGSLPLAATRDGDHAFLAQPPYMSLWLYLSILTR